MKSDINFDDKIYLPWLTALTRVKVSNKSKDIKKNDSSFELHDQFLAAVQTSYLVNMFDNFMEKNFKMLENVTDTESAVKFVLSMLKEFDVQPSLILVRLPIRILREKMTCLCIAKTWLKDSF